jgi:hypothetical protein
MLHKFKKKMYDVRITMYDFVKNNFGEIEKKGVRFAALKKGKFVRPNFKS